MTEKTEERETLLELCEPSAVVLKNPILRAIVESAPNPRNAYEYMIHLGWDSQLANRVSATVRFQKKLRTELGDKAVAQFSYPSENSGLSLIGKTRPAFASKGLLIALNLDFAGHFAERTHWPLICCDFMQIRDQRNKATTLDYLNSYYSQFYVDSPDIWIPTRLLDSSISAHKTDFGKFALGVGETSCLDSQFTVGKSPILICGRNLMLRSLQLQGPYPEFWKVVRITKQTEEQGRNFVEEVRIRLRQDLALKDASKKIVQVGQLSYCKHHRFGINLLKTLEVRYMIDQFLQILPLIPADFSIKTTWADSSMDVEKKMVTALKPDSETKNIGEVESLMLGTLHRFAVSGRVYTLPTLFGDEFLKSPPPTLAELFF